MSLISYGNACNMSAQSRERFRQRREKNKERIDSARKSLWERQELKTVQHPRLEKLMEDFYLSFGKENSDTFSLSSLSESLDELYSNVISELLRVGKESSLGERLYGIENMVSSIKRTASLTKDEKRVQQYITKSVPELYVSFLKNVECKFGDEIYRKL